MPRPIEGNPSGYDPIADFLSAYPQPTDQPPANDAAHLARMFDTALEIVVAPEARATITPDYLLQLPVVVETLKVPYAARNAQTGFVAIRGFIATSDLPREKDSIILKNEDTESVVDRSNSQVRIYAAATEDDRLVQIFDFKPDQLDRLFPHVGGSRPALNTDVNFVSGLLSKMRKSYGIPEKQKK